VCLRILVRKCFCDVNTCERKIKASRLTPFARPLARVTVRLLEARSVPRPCYRWYARSASR
jgi:hypothetical protein